MLKNMTEIEFTCYFNDLFSDFIKDNLKDKPAINELFCNWSDGLHRDGLITDFQVQNYCHLGNDY